MNSFIVNTDEVFGHKETTVIIKGDNSSDLRKSFEAAMVKIRPQPNEFQKFVYGEQRLNSLPDKQIKDIVDNKRGMGNTTAQAMSQVVEAIRNPNKPIRLVPDHGDTNAIFTAAGGYRDVVKHIIDKLDLKFMVIHDAERTLTFEV